MELKSCPLLSAVLVASFHYQVSAVSRSAIASWQPIKDLNSPVVLDIGRFAVSEHNKNDHAKLQFVKVVKGESRHAESIDYKLVITANNGAYRNEPGNYVAVVLDKPWAHFRQLVVINKV